MAIWLSSPFNALPSHTGALQEQLASYVEQLGSADHQEWMREAIEKEKLKQQHLQVVIQHLESEVSNLSKETIKQMEESMLQVREGIILAKKGVFVEFL